MEKGDSSVKELEERWAGIRLEEEGVLVHGDEEKRGGGDKYTVVFGR